MRPAFLLAGDIVVLHEPVTSFLQALCQQKITASKESKAILFLLYFQPSAFAITQRSPLSSDLFYGSKPEVWVQTPELPEGGATTKPLRGENHFQDVRTPTPLNDAS